MMTYLKMLLSDWSTMQTALSVELQHLSWASSDSGHPLGENYIKWKTGTAASRQ
ncbi:hypothetical protein ACFLV7_07135 [Chloroflexota bacterium]